MLPLVVLLSPCVGSVDLAAVVSGVCATTSWCVDLAAVDLAAAVADSNDCATTSWCVSPYALYCARDAAARLTASRSPAVTLPCCDVGAGVVCGADSGRADSMIPRTSVRSFCCRDAMQAMGCGGGGVGPSRPPCSSQKLCSHAKSALGAFDVIGVTPCCRTVSVSGWVRRGGWRVKPGAPVTRARG